MIPSLRSALLCLLYFNTFKTVAVKTEDLVYDYIVVGSGAGGGPLACRLAMGGFKTLLIEAGNDQGDNINTTVPAYHGRVTEDPKLQWDFFVSRYPDQKRQMQDPKFTWEVGPSQYHVGANPPNGSKPLGLLYPRAGTLGGCVTHNTLVWHVPQASDWDSIANLTGDASWSFGAMAGYLDKVYEWLPVAPTDPSILLTDTTFAQHVAGGAAVMGSMALGTEKKAPTALHGLATAFLSDPNSNKTSRDSTEGYFQIPLTQKDGARAGVRDFIESTIRNGYPLTIRLDCFVTKVQFDNSTYVPAVTGVEFLEGEYLYRASPLSQKSPPGSAGSATATKEVILSGGAFNTVQLLKLSGIGPKEELNHFKIPVVHDLAGVGNNLQDRAEVPVVVQHKRNFAVLDGCTFDGKLHDHCLTQWNDNPYAYAQRGPYASNAFATMMGVNSQFADNTDLDLYILGGPIDFEGYFPGYAKHTIRDHKHFTWLNLKAHTRNRAGTVRLNSADPLDTPAIDFNFFDAGTTTDGVDQLDILSLVQGINMTRQALANYHHYGFLGGDEFVETAPGANVITPDQLEEYVRTRAWGHHASCSCPIGADDDPNSVLDSKFRVRGVNRLRVVDASVFPTIPGSFIQAAVIMVSEKAADVVLNG